MNKDQVLEILSYDAKSGSFFWKERRSPSCLKGQKAGFVGKRGYVDITIDGKKFKAHTLVWLLETGEFPEVFLDHKDGDRTNNIFSNLRQATSSQNQRNRGKKLSESSSMYKGVDWREDYRSWRARIRAEGKQISLGHFQSETEAALAYNEAAKKHFGEYAKLNVISNEAQLVEN